MNIRTEVCILKNRLKYYGIGNITVNGNSMLPTIKSGEQVQLVPKETYQVGDILVFCYSENDIILVHRLVLKYGGNFYCKGDNSFRLEKISEKDVIGCVTYIKREGSFVPIPKPTKEFISHSLKVNFEYCQLGYDTEKIEASAIYCDYKKKYLSW